MQKESNDWKQEFIDKINKQYLENININEALEFKNEFVPKSLFRYRFYDMEKESIKSKRELENLELGQIWLSSPDGFNDPYDTLPMTNKPRTEVYDKIFDLLLSLRETFKICCFSETVDNTLIVKPPIFGPKLKLVFDKANR